MTKVGKYELVRKLATGGMAEVFLARFEWARGLEKTIVVKRILYHLAEDPSFIEMFFTEAQLAAQLSHPNIAQIIEFGESEGVYFLAMEYIDGPSLRSLAATAYAQGATLPLSHCARIAAFCCEALTHAHELKNPATGEPLNLVHRDVSPDNVLISKTGSVKLVDFGIAKAATQNHHTKTGLVKGKLAYMSPEQLRAEPLDRRADIFALGVMLYELVAGRKPYEASSEVTLIHAMLYEEMVPLRARCPDVAPELERIVSKALERNRDQRWADCRKMHAALEEYLFSTRQPVSALQIAELVEKYGVVPAPAEGTPPSPMATPSRPQPTVKTPEPWRAERTPAGVVATAQFRPVRLRTGTDGVDAESTEREAPAVAPPHLAKTTEFLPSRAPTAAAPPAPVPSSPAPSPPPAPSSPRAVEPQKPAKTLRSWMMPAAAVLLVTLGVGVGFGLSRRSSPEEPRSTRSEERRPEPIASATVPMATPAPPEPEPPPALPAKHRPPKVESLSPAPSQAKSHDAVSTSTALQAKGPNSPAASPAQVKPSTQLASAPAQFGKVTIRARPVPLVTIDGVHYDDKAIVDLPLGVGPHTATLVCDSKYEPACEQVSQRTHTIQFTVTANETQNLKYIFK